MKDSDGDHGVHIHRCAAFIHTGDPEGTGRRALVEGSGKILMVS